MVSFSDVSFFYEGSDEPVLKDFSAVIEDGEFLVITGESGVGKTTIIRLLLKEAEPSKGEIFVLGKSLKKMRQSAIPAYRQKLGVVF